mgnify:CR=1 FL=1
MTLRNADVYVNPNYEWLANALYRPRVKARTISNSRRGGFASCQQRWAWRYQEGLVPKTTALPLRRGSLVHLALAVAYQKLEDPDPAAGYAAMEAVISAWALGQAQQAQLSGLYVDWREVEELAQLCRTLAHRTLDRYWESDRAQYTLVGTEIPVRLPIRNPYGKRGMSRWDFTGKIDMILLEKATNELHVFDHKTWSGSEGGKAKYEAGLMLSPQRIGYMWALIQGTASQSCNWIETEGQAALYVNPSVTFNTIRTKVPSVPKLLQHRTCKGGGCHQCGDTGSMGVGKTVSDTSVDAYRLLAKTHPHIDAAQYAHHIKTLEDRGDIFNFRSAAYVDSDSFEMWEREVYDTAVAMAAAFRSGRYVRNRNECTPWTGGKPCSYRVLCDTEEQSVRQLFDREVPKGLTGSNVSAICDDANGAASTDGNDDDLPF